MLLMLMFRCCVAGIMDKQRSRLSLMILAVLENHVSHVSPGDGEGELTFGRDQKRRSVQDGQFVVRSSKSLRS
jgi:hypothetical protein